ncbi:hypothetical protein ACQKGL_02020 [Ensifer adhaerens]|uniref:hypothetical protein n=1 Tax=Ensifer adhaerens TaxID=106592 RepID=UPI003D0451E0
MKNTEAFSVRYGPHEFSTVGSESQRRALEAHYGLPAMSVSRHEFSGKEGGWKLTLQFADPRLGEAFCAGMRVGGAA